MLIAIDVPLASSLAELGDVSARLVDEYFIYKAGRADAEEQRALEAERDAKRKR